MMKAGRLDEAEKLYELASRKDDPFRTKWISWLARIHLRQKKTSEFLADLVSIASFDADNIDVRRALAEPLPGFDGDGTSAEKWAGDCLHINVYDPVIHVLVADAQSMLKKYSEATQEYQTALVLKPKKPDDVKVKLAELFSVQAIAKRGQGNSWTASSRQTPIIPRERRSRQRWKKARASKIQDASRPVRSGLGFSILPDFRLVILLAASPFWLPCTGEHAAAGKGRAIVRPMWY